MRKLSEARRRIRGMFPDPLQRLATDWPTVDVRIVEMGERWEKVRWESFGPVICLSPHLHQVQVRAALVHAMEHLDRGEPCEPLRWQIEHRVAQATARWLIPDIERLAAAITAYDAEPMKVAHELWVPPFVVDDRIAGLSEDELVYIDKHRDAVA